MPKILVVAAHPDDETLGAGATIASHVAKGDTVSVAILGTGITARKEKGIQMVDELKTLRGDAKRALAKLGVNDVSFFDFPDNRFDSVDLLDIVKTVEAEVARANPEVVYTHHWGDLNIDHRRTFDAVMVACRPAGSPVKKIICFEVLSSTEWGTQTPATVFLPNMYVDVSNTLAKKLAALKEYKTEMRVYPHPRSLEGVESLAKTRGLVIGAKAAEAFEIVREIEG
jgi:LmbE family N-acetylglucosaminyl deacetylase